MKTYNDLVEEIKQVIGGSCGLWISNAAASAALRVCVEELLTPPSALEFNRAINDSEADPERNYHSEGQLHKYAMARSLFTNRRACYQPPKPKTLEERVTVAPWAIDPKMWIVLRDGWNCTNVSGFKDRRDAERMRIGLIAELKQKEQSK